MKVLHFFKTYWPDTFGGVERTIHAIASGTAKYSVQSDVLSLSATPAENTVRFDGHMAHKSKLDFDVASTGFSRSVFAKFAELSREADLVHYHFPWPMMDLVHLARHPRKPTILTYHSDIVKQKLLLHLYSPLMHRFLNDVDHIVATSPNYLETSKVLKSYRGKTSIIPLGLAESDYQEPSMQTVSEIKSRVPERFFLFVGVLRYYKGLRTLLEAAKQTGLAVVIAGDGPMRDELEAQAEADNLTNVIFLGNVSDDEKIALLDLSTALVFPSQLRSEAFGLSLVEASMRGKPMISCEIGTGTSYVNRHDITGYVVQPGNSEALSQAMLRLAQDESSVHRLGKAARHRYEENFTAEKMARSYVDLYGSVLLRK